jgi:hypothetical protein
MAAYSVPPAPPAPPQAPVRRSCRTPTPPGAAPPPPPAARPASERSVPPAAPPAPTAPAPARPTVPPPAGPPSAPGTARPAQWPPHDRQRPGPGPTTAAGPQARRLLRDIAPTRPADSPDSRRPRAVRPLAGNHHGALARRSAGDTHSLTTKSTTGECPSSGASTDDRTLTQVSIAGRNTQDRSCRAAGSSSGCAGGVAALRCCRSDIEVRPGGAEPAPDRGLAMWLSRCRELGTSRRAAGRAGRGCSVSSGCVPCASAARRRR